MIYMRHGFLLKQVCLFSPLYCFLQQRLDILTKMSISISFSCFTQTILCTESSIFVSGLMGFILVFSIKQNYHHHHHYHHHQVYVWNMAPIDGGILYVKAYEYRCKSHLVESFLLFHLTYMDSGDLTQVTRLTLQMPSLTELSQQFHL